MTEKPPGENSNNKPKNETYSKRVSKMDKPEHCSHQVQFLNPSPNGGGRSRRTAEMDIEDVGGPIHVEHRVHMSLGPANGD